MATNESAEILDLEDPIEAYDDDEEDEAFEDESVDDEGEFFPLLGPAGAIGKFLTGRRSRRRPLPRVAVHSPGTGVSSATLNTPQGNATLRLPQPVVSRQEFDATIRRVQAGINRDTARLNTVAHDVDELRTRIGAVVADTQRDIKKLRGATTRSNRRQRSAIARLERERSQQQMMSMLMVTMMQRDARRALEGHTHVEDDAAAIVDDSSDSSAMLIPMMMMSSGEGSGGSMNAMVPLMMMIAMKDKD